MPQNARHISNIFARRIQKYADKWASAYWHENPFCISPKADAEKYTFLWNVARTEEFPEIDAIETEMGYAVDPAWYHDLALHTQVVIKSSPICYQHGRVLYAALRNYLSGCASTSINIVETGTARGFSATVMAKAIVDSSKSGRIVTLDLLPHDRKMYWNCIDDLQGTKSRRELLSPWSEIVDKNVMFLEGDSRTMMSKFKMGRIHFAFLDGAHTYKDVIAEIDLVVPSQKAGDVIVFDDYSPSIFPGLVDAVNEGCRKYGYSMNVIRSKGDRAYVIARKNG